MACSGGVGPVASTDCVLRNSVICLSLRCLSLEAPFPLAEIVASLVSGPETPQEWNLLFVGVFKNRLADVGLLLGMTEGRLLGLKDGP